MIYCVVICCFEGTQRDVPTGKRKRGEGEFECKYCHNFYTTTGNLNIHVAKHCPKAPADVLKQREATKSKCPHCNRTFSKKHHLKVHIAKRCRKAPHSSQLPPTQDLSKPTSSTNPDPSTHLVEGWFTAADRLFATNADLPSIERDHRFTDGWFTALNRLLSCVVDLSDVAGDARFHEMRLDFIFALRTMPDATNSEDQQLPNEQLAAVSRSNSVDDWFTALRYFIDVTTSYSPVVLAQLAADRRYDAARDRLIVLLTSLIEVRIQPRVLF